MMQSNEAIKTNDLILSNHWTHGKHTLIFPRGMDYTERRYYSANVMINWFIQLLRCLFKNHMIIQNLTLTI